MPIYEYRCGECTRRVSLFFPSFSIAERRTSAGENRCPKCGGIQLTRLMSRARIVRVGGSSGDRALARIESGEDPDKVMEDLDPDALGGPGMDDEALDEGDDDFGPASIGLG
jgi:putative FmdB family regulatory protein